MIYRKIRPLTSLRFFAAAMIVVLHSEGLFGLPENITWPLAQAVSFFFVLSGFVLAYVYPRLNGPQAIGRFLLSRVARLWPAHIAVLMLFLLFSKRTLYHSQYIATWPLMAIANFTMTHAWIPLPSFFFSYNGPSWCISTEFFFYLCFPFLIYRWRQTWLPKLLLAFALLIIIVSVANLTHLSYYMPGRNSISIDALVTINPLGRLLEFVIGMSMALIWRKLILMRFSGILIGTLLEVFVVGLVVASMYYTPLLANWAGKEVFGDAGQVWIAKSASAPFYGALILIMAWDKGLVARLLSHSYLVSLGELSYSIYLLHGGLIDYYKAHCSAFAAFPGWIAYGIFWFVLLLLAHLMWCLIEEPCRRLLVGLWPAKELKDADVLPSKAVKKPIIQHFAHNQRWIVADFCLLLAVVLMVLVCR